MAVAPSILTNVAFSSCNFALMVSIALLLGLLLVEARASNVNTERAPRNSADLAPLARSPEIHRRRDRDMLAIERSQVRDEAAAAVHTPYRQNWHRLSLLLRP